MTTATLRGVKGFNDVLPSHPEAFLHSALWQRVWRTSAEVMQSFGYAPVWLPLLEETSLFVRGLGEQTDVVAKEMYTLTDRGNRNLALRPEGTAGAVRAYLEHHLVRNEPQQRWYYQGPMFRAERPQKGRYRQFYQLGAEYFGSPGPGADVELLLMLRAMCQALGLPPIALRINTLGDAESRAAYKTALVAFFAQHESALCGNCQLRATNNPLRVLDCKEPTCQPILAAAPDILQSLTAASRGWFGSYCKLLDQVGLTYARSAQLVRGLDYYSEAIFEMTTQALGAQDAVFGGGRYDGLVASLGGPPTPAVGFAAGIERLVLLLADAAPSAASGGLMIAATDDASVSAVLRLAQAARAEGLSVVTEADPVRSKAAIKRAGRVGARYLLAIGEAELAAGHGQLRCLGDGVGTKVALVGGDLRGACRER